MANRCSFRRRVFSFRFADFVPTFCNVARRAAFFFRRAVAPYMEYVRGAGAYHSREYDFGDDAMEVSIRNGAPAGRSRR